MAKIKKYLVIVFLVCSFLLAGNIALAADCIVELKGTCVWGSTACVGVGMSLVDATGCPSGNYCCAAASASVTTDPTTGDRCNGSCISASECSSRGGTVDSTGACLDETNVCCTTRSQLSPVVNPSGDTQATNPTQTTPPSTTANQGGSQTTEFPNPIKYNTLQELLGSLLKTLQGIVALIAIIMIIVGGIMYMMAGVDEKMMETAKKTIGGALIGIAIIFAAPAFLKEILKIIGGTDESGLLANALTLKQIAENILNLLLSIVGILGIIGLVVGGVFYMTAYGDEDRIRKGKDIVTASLVGILVAAASLILVRQIAVLLAK